MKDALILLTQDQNFSIEEELKKDLGTTKLIQVQDLGFSTAATDAELFAAIKAHGYKLLPPLAAVTYCLQKQPLPKSLQDSFCFAMEPIVGADDRHYVLQVKNDEGALWLFCQWSGKGRIWQPDLKFLVGV